MTYSKELALLTDFEQGDDPVPYSAYLYCPSTIILRFELREQTSLTELRIDATALFEAKKRFRHRVEVRVELHYSNQDLSNDKVFTFHLDDIHCQALVALDKLYNNETHCQTMTEAKVWVNSIGAVQEINTLNASKESKTLGDRQLNKGQSLINEVAYEYPDTYPGLLNITGRVFSQVNRLRAALDEHIHNDW
jgi:hypothetical protein